MDQGLSRELTDWAEGVGHSSEEDMAKEMDQGEDTVTAKVLEEGTVTVREGGTREEGMATERVREGGTD